MMSDDTRKANLARAIDPAERAGLLTNDHDTHQPRTATGQYLPGPEHGPRKIAIVAVTKPQFIALGSWQAVFATRLIRNWQAAEYIRFTHSASSITRKIKSAVTVDGITSIQLEQ